MVINNNMIKTMIISIIIINIIIKMIININNISKSSYNIVLTPCRGMMNRHTNQLYYH